MKFYQNKQVNVYGQDIGCTVENRARAITIQPLLGQYVDLIPFHNVDVFDKRLEQFFSVIEQEPDLSCWTYLPYEKIADIQQLRHLMMQNFGFSNSIFYFISVTGQFVGYLGLMNLRENIAVLEIGNVYFSHQLRQHRAATEAMYLLLRESFVSGYRRVEWKCDDLNQASKNAALRFGFSYEGLFRQDRIYKGRNRNTAWFSMLDEEWYNIQHAYTQWLAPDNFNKQHQQVKRLQDFFEGIT